MPTDPHIGSDWTSAHTDPAAEIVALRRDVRRLEGDVKLDDKSIRILNETVIRLIQRIEVLEARHADE